MEKIKEGKISSYDIVGDTTRNFNNLFYGKSMITRENMDLFLYEVSKMNPFELNKEKVIMDKDKISKLEKLENRYCKAFSSGEKQLLLLASSIMHDAEITIFDELTANLDISRLKEVFEIFNSDLLKQKIIITHNLDLANALKYKVLFVKDGKIEFFGEHEEFFTNENLQRFYNNTILKLQNHLVVNL